MKIMIGVSVMFFRNLDVKASLCNGTTLSILKISNTIIQAKEQIDRTKVIVH